MSDDLVLQVRDLNVWYRPSGTVGRRKRQQVLHDVSFELHRGEILGLVGESGSGKPTLARTILGFVPDYTGNVYGRAPVLEFHKYLCPVRKFGSMDELAALIHHAAEESKAYFAAQH